MFFVLVLTLFFNDTSYLM